MRTRLSQIATSPGRGGIAASPTRRGLAASILALGLAACATAGPDYARPDRAVAAMPDASPLLATSTRSFRYRMYRSDLYLAYWEDGEAIAGALDGRVAYPEVATL